MNSQKQSNLIFLGGIHGVGKSSFAKRLADRMNCQALTASKLIRQARLGKSTWDSKKRAAKIDENQELLLGEINKKLALGGLIILDGHYSLKDTSGYIKKLPTGFFKKLNPKILLMLLGDPVIVSNQLNSRDGKNELAHNVEIFQSIELEHARSIGKTLNIPLLEVNTPDADYIAIELDNLLQIPSCP